MTDIDYIRTQLKMYIQEVPVDINYLSRIENSISLGTTGTLDVKEYVNGTRVITKQYHLSTTKPFKHDIASQAEGYSFFQNLVDFIREHITDGEWDDKHIPIKVEIINSGYIQQTDTTLAKWIMQFKFTYREV